MAENQTTAAPHLQEEHQVPFCRPFLCSTSFANGTDHGQKVLWACVPAHCKVYVLVFLGFIVMLAAMTITFNCLILGINLAAKTRQERKQRPAMSNYVVYVVFLAIADLLVGIVVLPLCLVNFYLEFMVNELPNSALAPEGREKLIIQSGYVEMSGDFATDVSEEVNAIDSQDAAVTIRSILGVFTHLTLFVSVYTLIVASADRLYAATSSQPTKRSTGRTKTSWWRETFGSVRRSTVAVSIVWILGIVFALLPVLPGSELHFSHVGHIFAAMSSDKNYKTVVRWYLLALVIPLIGIWFLNAAICFTLWRRKSQLGQQRKRSLQRKHSPGPSNTILPTNSNSNVFEQRAAESYAVQKYPASAWNHSPPIEDDAARPQLTFHPICKNKSRNTSKTAMRSPPCMRPQSYQWESRGSTFRRKVSSIRRAKEMLSTQSCEANITKTLSIVVGVFTIAVLPLIITLSMISVRVGHSSWTLNGEITALSLSLLLLFSNSLVNCVIYGARLRDFRKSLNRLFRKFVGKIKATFCCCCCCCCCPDSTDSISSEVVKGTILVTKNQRTELYQRSPSLGVSGDTFESVKRFSRISPRKSCNREPTMDNAKNRNKNSKEATAPLSENFHHSIPILFPFKEVIGGCGTRPKSNSTQEGSPNNTTRGAMEASRSAQIAEKAAAPHEPRRNARSTSSPGNRRNRCQSTDDVAKRSSTTEQSKKEQAPLSYNDETTLAETTLDTFLDELNRTHDAEMDLSIDFTFDINFSQLSCSKFTL